MVTSVRAPTKCRPAEGMFDGGAEPVEIGRIEAVGRFTESKYGDERLHFRHITFEEDLKLEPLWAADFNALPGQVSTMRKTSFFPRLPLRSGVGEDI